MINLFGPKCPKCDSKNVKTVNESLWDNMRRSFVNLIFPFRLLFGAGRKPKPLYICRNSTCGFSWNKP